MLFWYVFQRLHASNQVKGDEAAVGEKQTGFNLEQLMDTHGNRLLRLCTLYLKDADLARDAVQDTFLRAYRYAHTYRGEASETTWLTTIAMNVCRSYQRTGWFRHVERRAAAVEQKAEPFVMPDHTVLQTVMKLPDKLCLVILLRYYQGMTLAEIAAALRITEGAVRKRLRRASVLLHDQLKEWYHDEDA